MPSIVASIEVERRRSVSSFSCLAGGERQSRCGASAASGRAVDVAVGPARVREERGDPAGGSATGLKVSVGSDASSAGVRRDRQREDRRRPGCPRARSSRSAMRSVVLICEQRAAAQVDAVVAAGSRSWSRRPRRPRTAMLDERVAGLEHERGGAGGDVPDLVDSHRAGGVEREAEARRAVRQRSVPNSSVTLPRISSTGSSGTSGDEPELHAAGDVDEEDLARRRAAGVRIRQRLDDAERLRRRDAGVALRCPSRSRRRRRR